MNKQKFSGNPLDRSYGNKKDDLFLYDCLLKSTTKIIITSINKSKSKSILCNKVDSNNYELFYIDTSTTLKITNLTDIKEVLDSYIVVLLGCLYDNNDSIWIISIDISNQSTDDIIEKLTQIYNSSHLLFDIGRSLLVKMDQSNDLSIAGLALSLSTWHDNNIYDGKTGLITRPVECGMKRQVVNGNNKLYPRIDPVMIACVVSPDNKMCLLGHMKRMPQNFFSCLSGFIEACETIEEAVRREVWEESGVKIGEVTVISSQPWPLGKGGNCELMIGCYAKALTTEINIQDDEVDEVRWFSYDEAKSMVKQSINMKSFLDSSYPYIPGPYAIAHHLVKKFVDENYPGTNNTTIESNSKLIGFSNYRFYSLVTVLVSVGIGLCYSSIKYPKSFNEFSKIIQNI